VTDLTENEVKALVKTAMEESTKSILLQLGIDSDNALDVQKDLAFLRRQRESSEAVARWVKRGVIMTALSSLATVVWLGIQQAFKG